jgi:exodeoxyribonuclease VII large subunit
MSQLSFFEPSTWSVSEITRYLHDLLGSDPALQGLWVYGEVSNLSRPSSGHVYFTLKDAGATLRCVMWRNTVVRQPFLPREGDAIEAHGSIEVYEAGGQYQLYADLLRPAGEGMLFREFMRLKAQLEAEGLFDPERKRPLPRWPKRIGIVTSPSGAALRDMLNTLRRRYPLVEVVLAPTAVQGDEAPGGIVGALEALNRVVQPDVILLARGGGSIEDLWAFNDERVARAIAASAAPVITGVGHETDFTIADFTADLRAPTPTAAAELATPSRGDLLLQLADLGERLERALLVELDMLQTGLAGITNSLVLHSPRNTIRNDRQRLDELSRRASSAIAHSITLQHVYLAGFERRLDSLNPMAVLERGYAVVTGADGALVSSAMQVTAGDAIRVRQKDGSFGARVEPEAGEKRE